MGLALMQQPEPTLDDDDDDADAAADDHDGDNDDDKHPSIRRTMSTASAGALVAVW